MTSREMTTRQTNGMGMAEETRNRKHFVIPPVDILEDENGLTLVADMPGAEKEGISIGIENDILTIEGHTAIKQSGRNIHQEYESRDYHRRFQLHDGIDKEKAKADYNDGVLTLRLPKAEAAKPKQIKIETRH